MSEPIEPTEPEEPAGLTLSGEPDALKVSGEIKVGVGGKQVLAADILRSLKLIAAFTVVVFILIIAMGFWVYTNSNSNTEALCALRGEVEKRVETNQQFLIDNPKGIEGIDPKTIKTAIATSKSTLKALSGLNCD